MKKKQSGGNIVEASQDLITSFISLGKSIFVEIDSIQHISNDINNGPNPPGQPNKITQPPTYSPPPLH